MKQIRKVLWLYCKGMTDRRIAKEIGVCQRTVTYWRKKLGLQPVSTWNRSVLGGRNGVKHNDELAEELAKAAGISSAHYLKRSAVKLAEELGLELPTW